MPLPDFQTYRVLLYSLPERYASIRHSTLVLATIGRTLAKLEGQLTFAGDVVLGEGVTIEDNVFIGHNVTFINDRFSRATIADGTLQREADWGCEPMVAQRGASIGASAAL